MKIKITFSLILGGNMEKLYQYIVENYQTNEPIFLADIQIEGMKDNNIRQQVKKLTDAEKIKRLIKGFIICQKQVFSNRVHSFL